jgi:UDP-glucose 4-epimerase
VSRVLITGGAGPLGAAVARRLLADPAFDVRISDERPAAQWMREGCEMHRGDLRVPAQASAATKRCSHVVHLAGFHQLARQPDPSAGEGAGAGPHTLLGYEGALHGAVVRAAIERGVERFLYVSSPLVFERAQLFPTPEEHLEECRAPRSAAGFARLSGERLCRAAQEEHGLAYAICRPFGAYGPASPEGDSNASAAEPAAMTERPLAGPAADLGELIERAGAGERPLAVFGSAEQTLTPTHVDDLAEGIVAALSSPAAVNEDFNLAAACELSIAEIAQIAWNAGADRADASATRSAEGPTLESLPAREAEPLRSYPSAAKARELLGWEARIDAGDGIAAVASTAGELAALRVAAPAAGD